jgi:hypothetical protein
MTLALDQGLQIVSWVLDAKNSSEGGFILLEARIISAGIGGTEFVLAVDDKILEQLAVKLGAPDLTIGQACDYLSSKFIFVTPDHIPGGMAGSASARWVATRGRSNASGAFNFKLLGIDHAIEIKRQELREGTCFFVDKLIWNQKPIIGNGEDPLLLFHGVIKFEAATIAVQLANEYPNLNSLFSESETYLDLWDKFQDLEIIKLRDEMEASGCIAFKNRRPDEIRGCWVFELNDADAEFVKELDTTWADKVIEASTSVPDLDPWTPVRKASTENLNAPSNDRTKPFFAEFVRIDLINREIHLRIQDSDSSRSNQSPPKSGWLFPRWRGSQVQIKRRKQAIQRLLNPLVGIPSLIHLIQGLPVPHRRLHSISALSPAARDCFRGRKPTERQVEALRIALNTPDIAIIQGPPGTGKTRTIAALVQRLNELATRGNAMSKRFLLTSYQHDAVETVASATSLMDLPAIKFGRRGKQSDQSYEKTQIDHWIEELRNQIQADLAIMPKRPLSAVLRQVQDIRTGYLKSPGDNASTVIMLKDLKNMVGSIISTDTLREMKDLIANLGSQRLANEHEESRIRMALEGLRLTPASFNDDGPRGCFRLLNCIEQSRLMPEEKAALEAGEQWALDEDPPFLDTIAAFRDRLLQEISTPRLEQRALLANKNVCDVLENIANEIEILIQTSPQEGPAAALETFIEDLNQDPYSGKRAVERYSALLAATCQGAGADAVMSIFDTENTQFDTVIVDEAARANPLDLMIPMSLAGRRVVLVGDHRQLPHLLEPDVEKELESSASDETRNAIKQSLFEKLFKHARELEAKDGIKRCVTLDCQYRMHPVLADLVNSSFYSPYGEQFGSPNNEAFIEPLVHDVAEAGERVVLWKSVPLSCGKERRQASGHSWLRQPEAEVAAGTAYKILLDNPELSIGIITFYSAQVSAIMSELHKAGIAIREDDSDRLIIAPNFAQFPPGVVNRFNDKERLRVGTVDAFQGKEFDVVILSPVRSNSLRYSSDDPESNIKIQRKYGHLLLPNRMCVALSRQRRLLIVAGDDAMFRESSLVTNNVGNSEAGHPVLGLPEALRLHEDVNRNSIKQSGGVFER